ncbi:isocitrate lyase/PEP mutase family protein [Paracandidimonas soli]|uniref:Methylisocitrate lyase n=1 Tax=Paracandidimonas soli TaxID=1917182 RepID=A0A4R3VAZ1_9BURK|nr:isocitrate lyase/PEP mutase family protein [Paracandidimonas soli]TCV00728.1 methylisocitrate lyase [Paracandidimonas soli]
MTQSINKKNLALKNLIQERDFLVVPGIHDGLSARLAEAHGFPAIYVGSYATAASGYGIPDVGALSLTEMAEYSARIADAVSIPIIADAEDGFGNPANIWRTVRAFEQAGVSAIHIEDHAFGKHLNTPHKYTPLPEMIEKIKAALDARQDENFQIIARTDVLWDDKDEGEAIKRANAYAEAGADMVFVVGSTFDIKSVRSQIHAKLMTVNLGPTTLAEEKDSGANVILYYGFSLYAAYQAVNASLKQLASDPESRGNLSLLDDASEFETFMDYSGFAERARKYNMF